MQKLGGGVKVIGDGMISIDVSLNVRQVKKALSALADTPVCTLPHAQQLPAF
jgi:hypothetical protein